MDGALKTCRPPLIPKVAGFPADAGATRTPAKISAPAAASIALGATKARRTRELSVIRDFPFPRGLGLSPEADAELGGRGRPHGETCLTRRRRRRTATPSWWSWCRSWWL